MTLDQWLDSKEIPDDVIECEEGHIAAEFVDGAYRIWAAHQCPDKKMILKLKWLKGTYEANVTQLSTNDKVKKTRDVSGGNEMVIFHLPANNNRLALQLGETLPSYTT